MTAGIVLAAMASLAAQDKPVPAPPPPPILQVPETPRPTGANRGPTPRRPLNIVTSDYPLRALREEREGSVKVGLAVDRSGRVTECRVLASSGHADLDEAACNRLAARARFWPATDAAGEDMAGSFTTTIAWRIAPESPAIVPPPVVTIPVPGPSSLFPRAPRPKSWGWSRITDSDWPAGAREAGHAGEVLVSFDIDATGAVPRCRVVKSSGQAALDARSCAIVSERARFDPARGIDGQPAMGRGEQSFIWNAEERLAAMPRPAPPAPPPPGEWRRRPTVLPGFLTGDGRAAFTMTLGADGKATQCRVEMSGSLAGTGSEAMRERMCAEARERGFRTADPAEGSLPRKVEVTVQVKTDP